MKTLKTILSFGLIMLAACAGSNEMAMETPVVEKEKTYTPSKDFFWIDESTGKMYSNDQLVYIVNDTTKLTAISVLQDAQLMLMWDDGALSSKGMQGEKRRKEVLEKIKKAIEELKGTQ